MKKTFEKPVIVVGKDKVDRNTCGKAGCQGK